MTKAIIRFMLLVLLSVGSALAVPDPNRITSNQTPAVADRAGRIFPDFAGRPSHHRAPKLLAIGTWGGKDINLEVTKTGATVEFACAHATINGPIRLDRSGRFNVVGANVSEGPGPTRDDAESRAVSMRFKGKVTGQKMELTIANNNGNVGAFTLTFGRATILRKCK